MLFRSVLFHFDDNGVSGRHKIMVLCAAAVNNTDTDVAGCATMGEKLKVRPGAEIVISIVVRDPSGTNYAPYTLPAADYELLWVDFGYNTEKDNLYYYLHHWDNFGFDGPVVDAREVHNYVTRIAGTDYQKAATFPSCRSS